MTELEGRVRQLLFEEGISTTEAARRLRIPSAEVVSIAVRARNGNGAPRAARRKPKPEPELPAEPGEQIDLLRAQVRQALIVRTRSGEVSEFPAAALVRLWQLVEDPKLLSGGQVAEEELFDIPEAVREEIFRLLDEGAENRCRMRETDRS